MKRLISYPLRATKFALEFKPFGIWWRPQFTYRRGLSEMAKANGETIWWARWLWFQLSFGRWV